MTYVVTDNCIKCKYMDCVEVCPVDCFYEGDNMLVIHPDECIDCGVCEPECPIDAIKPDTEPGLEKWLEVNAEYAGVWPNITQKKPHPPMQNSMKISRISLRNTSRLSLARGINYPSTCSPGFLNQTSRRFACYASCGVLFPVSPFKKG